MYPNLNSRSNALFQQAKAVLPSGYARHMAVNPPYPVYVDKAQGCWVQDVDGNRIIDFTNNFTSLIHGHCHPEIVKIVQDQAARVMSTTMPSEWEVKLGALIANRIPGVQQVRFCNTGTEAVMVASKMVRAITGKSRIAKMEGGYHGQFDLLEPSFQPGPPDWGPEEAPHTVGRPWVPKSLLEEVLVLPVNNIKATKELIERNVTNLAAIFIDPSRLNLGFVEPSLDYMHFLRTITAAHGILLVYDEVVSLRSGYNGRQGQIGIIPDITVMGKIIGGGLPIGAVGASAEIMSVFSVDKGTPTVNHSGTFTANPMSLAAGFTGMTMLTKDAFERMDQLGLRLRAGLDKEMKDAGITGRVEANGSSCRVVLTDEPTDNYRQLWKYLNSGGADRAFNLQNLLLGEGILGLRCGYVLSTPMTDADIDWTIEASGRAFKKFSQL
jgi:glutamate-1-semialdehyde 2,1-aminomutase